MLDEVFADRFADISLTGSTVRIDLSSLSPTEKEADGQPSLRFRQRVVLPVEGFLRSYEMMQRMMDLLVEQGIVAREQKAGTPTIIDAQPIKGSASPNFPEA